MKKNLFLFLLLLGTWQQTIAQQFVSGDLVYEITSPTTVKLSSQDPSLAGSIIIPASVDYNNQSYTVTVIDGYSFYGLLITSVVIPNTVTTIGFAAFSVCESLTSVTIPNSVTDIEDYAFALTGLTSVICNATTPPNIYLETFSGVNSSCSVTVPIASLTAYQAAPFWQNFNTIIGDGILNTTTVSACSSYTWENNNETYTETGVYTGTTTNGVTEQLDLTILSNFSVDGINYVVTSPTTVALDVTGNVTGDVIIPATVTSACGTYTVTSINPLAFAGSSGITSVTIPNSITAIGFAAFAGCTGLTEVICDISEPLNIDPSVFASVDLGNCSLKVPTGSVGAYQDAFVWENFDSISSNVVFNTTTVSACSSYTWENNNETYTETGVYTGTTTNGVTEQLNLTILSNFSVDGINYVITSPTTVAVDATNDATGAVVIPVTVTSSCGTYGVTSINYAAFAGSALTSVTIPDSVTNIDPAAFASCNGLTSVTIPNSVTNIGPAAFGNCSSLSTVSIGNSVTSIGFQAFAACTNLTSIVCNVSIPINIDPSVFGGVNQAGCSLTVPAGSEAAYRAAFVWQDFFPPTTATKIQDSQCGTTLAALSTVLVPVAVPLSQGYKFKVTNTVTNEVNYYTRNKAATFALSQRADTGSSMAIKLSSTYSIAVAVKLNGVYSAYGDACLVSTPLLPTTKIQDALCGTTLANINSYLYLKVLVKGVDRERYKVTQGSEERTYDRIRTRFNPFQLKQLVGGAAYATTYEIAVSVFYNGVWQPYGASCTVTTPAAPQSRLASTQCGMRLNKTNSNVLLATSVSVAQAYRFEVSKGASTYTVETASNLQRSFKMTEVPGLTLESGATYSIRVAIKANDTWQPYGTSCNVTTYGSPAPVKMAAAVAKPETVFNAVAYPNPFATAFQLKIDSASQTAVDLKVYDVMGRLIEQRQVNAAENSDLELGNNYPTGLFTIILNQGVDVKTLRVIKK